MHSAPRYTAGDGGFMQFAVGGGAPSAGCGQVPPLGFDYPPLRPIRQQLEAAMCVDYPPDTVAGMYAAALARLEGSSASDGTLPQAAAPPPVADAPAPQEPLAAFLADALAHVAAHEQPMRCTPDAQLLDAAGVRDVRALAAGGGGGSGADALGGAAVLLASNLHNSGALMPSFILQTLRLALLLPPGRLAVSVYESGSNDLTRQWAALLRMLLLPLRVPHNITLDGRLRPSAKVGRIQRMAALRNALVDPFLPTGAIGAGGGFVPDRVVMANDVFWCAEGALRLAMHRAHIACGFDFYTAPWEAGGASGGGDADARLSGQARGGGEAGEAGADAERSTPAPRVGGGAAKRRLAARQLTGSGGGGRHQRRHVASLRFYDKWVARDVSGAKLANLPPFVSHAPSASELAAGRPVAAYCCYNGLAVLDAAPLVRRGVRFRSSLPGECSASECSLLCDDYHRLGFSRVVLDPWVRVGYEGAQVAALDAASRGAEAAAGEAPMAAAGVLALDVRPTLAALGPRRPWSEVAAASAALRDGGGAAALDYGRVECCDLRGGRDFVDFARDCRRVDVMSTNYTARAAAAEHPQHRLAASLRKLGLRL